MPTNADLTTKDLQQRYGVSAVTIWNWRKAGKLKSKKLPGGKVRFEHQEVLRFEASNPDWSIPGEIESISA